MSNDIFTNDQSASEARRHSRMRVRRAALSAFMLLFLALLILMLIAAASDRTDILRLAAAGLPLA